MSNHKAVLQSLQVAPVAVPLVLQRRELVPAAPGRTRRARAACRADL